MWQLILLMVCGVLVAAGCGTDEVASVPPPFGEQLEDYWFPGEGEAADVDVSLVATFAGEDLEVSSSNPRVVRIGETSDHVTRKVVHVSTLREGDAELVVTDGERTRRHPIRVRRPTRLEIEVDGRSVDRVVIDEYESFAVFFEEFEAATQEFLVRAYAGDDQVLTHLWHQFRLDAEGLSVWEGDDVGPLRSFWANVGACRLGEGAIVLTSSGGSAFFVPIFAEVAGVVRDPVSQDCPPAP